MEPMDEVKTICVNPLKPEREVKIGEGLTGEKFDDIVCFLQSQEGQFAWEGESSEGISSEIIEHRLNIHPQATPVKQKKEKHGN